MEAVLRPLGMTVTHCSCLELLAQRPGLSSSEATAAIRAVETRMLSGMTPDEQVVAFASLTSMVRSLRASGETAP